MTICDSYAFYTFAADIPEEGANDIYRLNLATGESERVTNGEYIRFSDLYTVSDNCVFFTAAKSILNMKVRVFHLDVSETTAHETTITNVLNW